MEEGRKKARGPAGKVRRDWALKDFVGEGGCSDIKRGVTVEGGGGVDQKKRYHERF